jgi:hypothetical protein
VSEEFESVLQKSVELFQFLKQKENSIAVEFLKGFESVRIEVALNGLESNKVTKTRNTEAIVFIWFIIF